MQTNPNLLNKKFTAAQKTLIGLNVLIAVGASWLIYWVPPIFKGVFNDMGALLPAPTLFVIDWHHVLMWLPVLLLLFVFAFCHKNMQGVRKTTLVITLLGNIGIFFMTIAPLYLPIFSSCEVI